MQQHNLYTQIEDFLTDPSFRLWADSKEDQQVWEQWILENPKQTKLVEEARLWSLAMKGPENNLYQGDIAFVVVKAYLLSCVRKQISQVQELDSIFRQTTSIDSIKFLFDFSIKHHLITDESTAAKVFHLNTLLNDLPDRQKEALYLRYYQGLSIEQIADTLKINYQSANHLLHRALVGLRKEWKENLPLLLLLSSNFF